MAESELATYLSIVDRKLGSLLFQGLLDMKDPIFNMDQLVLTILKTFFGFLDDFLKFKCSSRIKGNLLLRANTIDSSDLFCELDRANSSNSA